MVDKIIEFNESNPTVDEIEKFQNEVILTGNARYIYLLAQFVDGVDIDLLTKHIIELNDSRYIRFFMRSIKGVDYNILVNKVLESEDAKYVYYCLFDTKNMPHEYFIKFAKRIYELKDIKYLGALFYYYFNIKKYDSEEMFELLNVILKDNNVDIVVNKENVLSVIDSLRKKIKYPLSDKVTDSFTSNCYKGRNGLVPDMIVCHRCNEFNKTLNMFYDPVCEVSSHFVIDETGEVKQVVDLPDSAWENGTSLNDTSDVYYKFSKNELVKNRAVNANYFTFSIEHISFDGNLTDKQYEASLNVMKKIITFIETTYHIEFLIDREHIVGHQELNPIVRTVCPGDYFPFERLIKDLKDWKNVL